MLVSVRRYAGGVGLLSGQLARLDLFLNSR